MSNFTYNDIVTAKPDAPKELRPGERGWIVGMSDEKSRKGSYREKFPDGVVYTVEFEDGSSVSAKEAALRKPKDDGRS